MQSTDDLNGFTLQMNWFDPKTAIETADWSDYSDIEQENAASFPVIARFSVTRLAYVGFGTMRVSAGYTPRTSESLGRVWSSRSFRQLDTTNGQRRLHTPLL